MGTSKKGIDNDESQDSDHEDNDIIADETDFSSSDSDDSDSSISEADNEQNTTAANALESDHHNSDAEQPDEEEEEEDELIKAIRRENQRERDHPPNIKCEDFITDISFHPQADLLAVASITGDVFLYNYTNNENTLKETFELHVKACRDIEFSEDGDILFSASKDKSITLSDVRTGKLKRFYEKAHNDPIYCLSVLTENLIATGDDEGVVKLWDIRDRQDSQVFQFKKNEDYISDIITEESEKHLICSSGDGSLTTYDLQQRKFLMQSEEYDEELTCLGILRSNTKLLVGSSNGKLFLYNWNEFGLHSDIFPGKKTAINALIPITENIVITACEDGNLRATHLFPHQQLGVVGQHELSVERLDICNNGQFIASSSHDNDIKFWNIQYFEDFERASKPEKTKKNKRESEFNLPSSKRQNVADFFSDLG